MNRSLVCVHCGERLDVQRRPDVVHLRTHLVWRHAEALQLAELSRWAELLEHYRVLPLRASALPGVLQLR